MERISDFLKTTFTGGILFLLPVCLLIFFANKAREVLVKLAAPLSRHMPEVFLGLDGSNILAILLLLIICFICGLLFKTRLAKKGISKLEDSVLAYFPGYSLIKSITADALGSDTAHEMHPVLVQDDENWNIGFLVEESEGLCTVFLPEAPRHDSGEVKIMPASAVKKLDITTNVAGISLRSYGKGAIEWMKENQK